MRPEWPANFPAASPLLPRFRGVERRMVPDMRSYLQIQNIVTTQPSRHDGPNLCDAGEVGRFCPWAPDIVVLGCPRRSPTRPQTAPCGRVAGPRSPPTGTPHSGHTGRHNADPRVPSNFPATSPQTRATSPQLPILYVHLPRATVELLSLDVGVKASPDGGGFRRTAEFESIPVPFRPRSPPRRANFTAQSQFGGDGEVW